MGSLGGWGNPGRLRFHRGDAGRRVAQHFSNFSGQFLGTIWLLYERDRGIQYALASDRVVGVTGSEDYFYSGTVERQLMGQFGTAHFRHHDVGEQDVNGSREVPAALQSVFAGSRLENGIADGFQIFASPLSAGNGGGSFVLIALFYFYVEWCEGEVPARGHAIPGVHRQVQEDLRDLSGVGFDSAKGRIERDFELDFRADQATQQNLHFLQRIFEIEDSRLHQLLAAIGEELPGQVCRGHARLPDYFEFLDGGVTRWKRVQDDVRVPQDHGQQIVEVVGHAPSEPANGIHALRQPELFLHLSSCGDMHDGAGHKDDFFGVQRPQTDFYGKLGAILAPSEQLHARAHGAPAGDA